MATLSTAARNAAANAVVDLCDVSGPGDLVFLTSGDVAVATLTLSNPAFGNATNGVATANAVTQTQVLLVEPLQKQNSGMG